MDLHEQPYDILSYRFRSARQKKRLQKKDFDKTLRRLNRRDTELRKEIRELPMVPLETPYQKGWKRFFILTPEVSRSASAPFYQALLDKINTIQYSPDKHFRNRRRRKRKKVPGEWHQELRQFQEGAWYRFSQQLTECEKSLFYRQEKWYHNMKPPEVQYIFREPWRFELRIRPHIITHINKLDPLLQSESQQIGNYITTHYLDPRISKLCYGRYFHWYNLEPDRRICSAPNGKEPVRELIRKSREQNETINPLWDK